MPFVSTRSITSKIPRTHVRGRDSRRKVAGRYVDPMHGYDQDRMRVTVALDRIKIKRGRSTAEQ